MSAKGITDELVQQVANDLRARYVSDFDGLVSASGLNIPAGSEFCAALSA